MIITADEETVFRTIQNTFMIKALGKIRLSRILINPVKIVY